MQTLNRLTKSCSRLEAFQCVRCFSTKFGSDFEITTGIYPIVSPPNPQKTLFSSLINSTSQQYDKEMEGTGAATANEFQRPSKQSAKTTEFALSRSQYNSILQKKPKGSVNSFVYNDTNFVIAGLRYDQVPEKNVYKLLLKAQPEIIVLQLRPDQILKNFQPAVSKKDNPNVFSSSGYFDQILRKAEEVMPSHKYRMRVYENLVKGGIFADEPENQANTPKFKPYQHIERLSLDAIAAVCFYAEKRKIPIVLGDLPEIVWRENIVNKTTTGQLEAILSRAARQLPNYPNLVPSTPLTIANVLNPEVFVVPSDRYMTNIFEYLIHRKHKRVFALVGLNQADSLLEYLDNYKISGFKHELEITPPKSIPARHWEPEDLVERHSILDVLTQGKKLFENFSEIQFRTTYQIIRKYGDYLNQDNTRYEKLKVLHYEHLKKYHSIVEQQHKEGVALLKKEVLVSADI